MKYIDARNTAAAAAIEKEGWGLADPTILRNEFYSLPIREVISCGLSDREFSQWMAERGLFYKDQSKEKETWVCPEGQQVDLKRVYEVLRNLNVGSEAVRQVIIDSLR